MSGHSKWSTIKRHKEQTDQARGKVFTKLANSIALAVKEGGGIADPLINFRLRLVIEKAKSANMPKEKIERALVRTHSKDGNEIHMMEALYEILGPGGVAILAQAITDNKQRTAATIKNMCVTNGGVLGGVGSVNYLFDLVGVIYVKKDRPFEEVFERAVEGGAVDIEESADVIDVFTKHSDLHRVKVFLEEKGMTVIEYEPFYRPLQEVLIEDQLLQNKVTSFLTILDDHDDIHKVYTNAHFKVSET